MENKQRLIVVGGGFAGLELIKGLGNSDKYEVILVDLNNYNFFAPLIYQVSTGFMEPSAISYPFRRILREKESVRFRLGSLQRVVPEENKVILSNGERTYDILVMVTRAENNFFGNTNIERYSLPMKTISDALSLRNTILARLDRATRLPNREDRKRLLTFVIAGAGPTGVELSGILAEMSTSILKKDYPELDRGDLGGIYLIDGQDAVLAAMSRKSQAYTFRKLKQYGVEIKLNTFVKDFDNEKVVLSDGTEIWTKNLIWAAGVTAKTFEGFRKDSFGKGNRLKTDASNLVDGYTNIYALGDAALLSGDEAYPNGHPQ